MWVTTNIFWNMTDTHGTGTLCLIKVSSDRFLRILTEKIYCGSSQEFGYFVKSGNSLIFRSLSDGLKEMNILIIT